MKNIFLKKSAPLGLKIISVIYYLTAIFSLVISGLAFSNSKIITSLPAFSQGLPQGASVSVSLGILFILIAVFSFLVALGLQNRNSVARIALAAFCLINVVGGIMSVIEGSYISIINLLFNALIAYYLIFNKNVRKEFKIHASEKPRHESHHEAGRTERNIPI